MKTSVWKKLASPFLYLFWKTQLDILAACPPLQDIAFKGGIGTDRSRRLWFAMLRRMIKALPAALLSHMRNLQGGRIVLSNVTVPVTTRCTLRCDKCQMRIPDLPHPCDTSASELIRDLRSLFSFVDCIYTLNFSGGEAFLHPALDEILLTCAGKAAHISVATNGTVLPDEKLLAALRTAKVTVRISKYNPELQPQAESLKHLLQRNSIPYIHESGAYWYDLRGETTGTEKRRFKACAQKMCLIFYGGKLFRCIQTVVLMEKGVLTDYEKDYIDLRSVDASAFREKWQVLRKTRVLSACAHCAGFTYLSPRIPVAVQREADHGDAQ